MLDVFQQFRIEETDRKVSNIEDNLRERKYTHRNIDERISKLSLVTQAVWSFIKETNQLDDSDLINRIEELDAKDGVKDGKATAVVMTCLDCSKKINTRTRPVSTVVRRATNILHLLRYHKPIDYLNITLTQPLRPASKAVIRFG